MGSNEVIKTIVETYKQFPLDKGSLQSFISSIFAKIDAHRLRVVKDENNKVSTEDMISSGRTLDETFDESYCHAFYRMLGLPVISKNMKFYNPGSYGKAMTHTENQLFHSNINKNQDVGLAALEDLRESSCNYNLFLFSSEGTLAREYKISMLKYPKPICMLGDIDSPFKPDNEQQLKITERGSDSLYVKHFLRPFKCNAKIAPASKSRTAAKLAAPFYESKMDESVEKLEKQYIETVCKLRFTEPSSDIKGQIETMIAGMQTVEIDGKNPFKKLLSNQSALEIFVSNVLFANFVNACLIYSDKIAEFRSLGDKIDAAQEKQSKITAKIEQLERDYNFYSGMVVFMPPDFKHKFRGQEYASQNPHSGVLASELVSLIDSPASYCLKNLESAKSTEKSIKAEANEVSNDMFYYTGEVTGIGIIDILALMLAFWLISRDALVSMLDEASFSRLWNDANNEHLRCEAVKTRHDKQAPPLDIEKALTEYDQQVFNLLSLADSIIKHNSKDKSK